MINVSSFKKLSDAHYAERKLVETVKPVPVRKDFSASVAVFPLSDKNIVF